MRAIPDGWRTTTLGALCREGGGDIQTGPFGSQLHASDYVAVGIPSVMPQNIGDNVVSDEDIARISPADAKRLSKYLLHENDIVYSRRGDVEKRALIRAENDGWLCGTGCLRVRFGDSLACDPKFVSYFLGTQESRTWIKLHAVGATMPNLNTSILSALPVRVPELHVQRGIADVLGALDDKIAANCNLIESSRQLSVLWLYDAASAPLADLVEHRRVSRNPVECGAVSVAHFSLPAFDERQRPEYVSSDEIKSAKFRITAPSVLISKLNPRFPRVWDVLDLPDVPAFASTEFLVLEPKYSSTSVLWAALSQPAVGHQLESMVAGTSGSHQRVKPADILKVQVADPRQLDAAVAEQITNLARIVHNAREESETLAALRDTLLPRLMSGELRVKDAEAVVADAV